MEYQYTAYRFNVSPKQPGTDILLAELSEKEFESFEETETGLIAYIQSQFDHAQILDDVQVMQSSEFEIDYTSETITQVNWNEEWEKNFSPIDVDGICYVRAPFHSPKNAEYEIVIEPKMSFGTGHHETTYLMMKYLLKLNIKDKSVLDMGCGTAILAILAMMRGAKEADAVDIDRWCYENSLENIQKNNIENITVIEGDAGVLTAEPKYDLVIANINRNILLADMKKYVQTMKPNSDILFSGFYTEDIAAIKSEAEVNGLIFVDNMEKNNWVALHFQKK